MGKTHRSTKHGNASRNARKKRVPAAEKGKQRPPLPPGVKKHQVRWDPYIGRYVRRTFVGVQELDDDDTLDERAA